MMSPRDMAVAIALMAVWGFNFVTAKWALEGFPPILLTALRFALVAIVGYGVWYRLLARYDVNRVMPCLLLLPAFGVACAVVVLGEALTWRLLIGGAITVAGVALIIFTRPEPVA